MLKRLISVEPRVVIGPSTEPVSLAEVKQSRGIADPSDATELAKLNADLNIMIGAARRYVEQRTGRTIHQTRWKYVLDAFPAEDCIVLPRATPLIGIVSLIYKDSSAVSTVWASSNYIADTDEIPGRLVLAYSNSWPSFTAYPVSPIAIQYDAGIATASPVTEADSDIKTACLLLIGGMYENRESEVVTDRARIEALALRYGVEAFLAHNVASYVF